MWRRENPFRCPNGAESTLYPLSRKSENRETMKTLLTMPSPALTVTVRWTVGGKWVMAISGIASILAFALGILLGTLIG